MKSLFSGAKKIELSSPRHALSDEYGVHRVYGFKPRGSLLQKVVSRPCSHDRVVTAPRSRPALTEQLG